MTPIKSSMPKVSSDSRDANQTFNGVYPVRPHLEVRFNVHASEILLDFNKNKSIMIKAEV